MCLLASFSLFLCCFFFLTLHFSLYLDLSLSIYIYLSLSLCMCSCTQSIFVRLIVLCALILCRYFIVMTMIMLVICYEQFNIDQTQYSSVPVHLLDNSVHSREIKLIRISIINKPTQTIRTEYIQTE